MNQRPSREETLFFAAAEMATPEMRATFLDRECAGDAALRQRVEALLKSAGKTNQPFMSGPALPEGIAPLPEGQTGTVIVPVTEKAGDRIGRYKLLQQIGEGGCGVVYMAEQEVPVRRRVALKVIKLGMDTKQVVARFEAERQALAMMDHQNIAKVLDAGATETGRPFFVMELVRGTKITEFADQQKLSTRERLDLFMDVCAAIQHAHQKGIIHRDLKPSNVLVTMIDGKPVPKVIDFGIAKATNQQRLTDKTLFTAFEQFIGTPAYMSPEQAEMSGVDIDTRSDIYSLGVLLYELLTGQTPFDSTELLRSGLDGIRKTLREQEPPKPSTCLNTLAEVDLTTVAKARHADAPKLLHSVRGDLDWVVMKCLEKDRGRRYDTANGLAMDLQRHLTNEPIVARPPSTVYRLQKLMRRNKLAFAAGTAIAASLVIGIAASLWQAVRAESEAKRAISALDELRASAPAFAAEARGLVAKEQFGEAIAKLDYALKLQPDKVEFLVQKADLFQCQLKLTEAAAIYRAALCVKPGLALAEASAKLCDELLAAPPASGGGLSRESLGRLHLAMQHQQRTAAELMPIARLVGQENKLIVEYWLERLKDLPISADKPLKDRLTVRDDSLLALDLKDAKITSLEPLLEMAPKLGKLTLWDCKDLADFMLLREFRALTYLDLDGTGIADLSPLRGLPLEELYIGATQVDDLSPLRGMPLKTLELYYCRRIADLAPLAGLPLKEFCASSLSTSDFAPLRDAPLEICSINSSSVRDLSFLAAAPIKELQLRDCPNLESWTWLRELKSLERLVLPRNYRSFPAPNFEAIAALRSHPRLKFIQAEFMQWGVSLRMLEVTQPKELFWRDWDREQSFLPAVRRLGLDFTLRKLPDDTYRLEIEKPLSNLSFLEKAPITELHLKKGEIADLAPIRNLKLRYLWLNDNPVADLSPLQGMPLEELALRGGTFSDLTPLAGLPLKSLYLGGCANVADVAPLAQLKTLVNLTVPLHARNIETLRSLPLVRLAANLQSSSPHLPVTTAADFWEAWPKLRWLSALREAGATPKTVKQLEDGTWEVDLSNKECRQFSDLTTLSETRISNLNLGGTAVTDLTPLKGLPLKQLRLYNTQVTDLRPLQGMSLGVLHVSGTRVSDLSPLRGMPLTFVRLHNCTNVTDVSALAEAEGLTSLTLPPNPGNIEFLRGFQKLERLSFTEESKTYRPNKTFEEFWQDYALDQFMKSVPGAEGRLKNLSGGGRELNLERLPITDLKALTGTPLRVLKLGNTKVTDLAPLRGMALQRLTVFNTQVKDLSPLKGMRLQQLHMSKTPVTDISVVRGMPLTMLRLHNCPNLTDLSPLAEAKDLAELTLPPNAKNFEFLRDARNFPKLKRISYVEDTNNERNINLPNKTADEFWKEYGAENKPAGKHP